MHVVSSAPPPDSGARLEGAAEELPRTFGRYTLFDLIGKGGMAQLYLARAQTDLGATRLAAVKVILPAFADDSRFAHMLIHEAKLAAGLSHHHVVQVFDLGRAEDRLFIAMEYVEGYDLNSLLRQCTDLKVALPLPFALGIVCDALEGLDYAHRRADDFGVPLGVVHRDVSPSNVLISYEGEVKLCDFGIAHANEHVGALASEALKGKAGYMSPEHARGEALDVRADVFAAGIILWELLAGRRLYKRRTDVPLLTQAQRAEVPPLPEKGLPNAAELERITRCALSVDRDARYPSAAAFLRDLQGYIADAGLNASRLRLGEWISSTFGTAMLERRRASERRLPKARPSERLRAADSSSSLLPSVDGAEVPEPLVVAENVRAPRDLLPLATLPGARPEVSSELPPPVQLRGDTGLAGPSSLSSGRPPSEPPPPSEVEGPASSASVMDAEAPPSSSSGLPSVRPSSEPPPPSSERPRPSHPPPSARRAKPPRAILPMSAGAIRAFRREVEHARSQTVIEPGSLAAATMDVPPSSHELLDPRATGRVSSPDLDAVPANSGRTARAVFAAAVLVVLALAALALRLVR